MALIRDIICNPANPSVEVLDGSNTIIVGLVHQAIRNGDLELVKNAVNKGYIIGNVDIRLATIYNQKKILLWIMKNDLNWERLVDQYLHEAKL